MNMQTVESIVRQLHETGNATKDLMAKTTVASGAVVGGPATPLPAVVVASPTVGKL